MSWLSQTPGSTHVCWNQSFVLDSNKHFASYFAAVSVLFYILLLVKNVKKKIGRHFHTVHHLTFPSFNLLSITSFISYAHTHLSIRTPSTHTSAASIYLQVALRFPLHSHLQQPDLPPHEGSEAPGTMLSLCMALPHCRPTCRLHQHTAVWLLFPFHWLHPRLCSSWPSWASWGAPNSRPPPPPSTFLLTHVSLTSLYTPPTHSFFTWNAARPIRAGQQFPSSSSALNLPSAPSSHYRNSFTPNPGATPSPPAHYSLRNQDTLPPGYGSTIIFASSSPNQA